MSYFAGLGDYNNTTGVGPTASEVVDGNTARTQNGDLYDEQTGDTTLLSDGDLNALRKGYSNSLLDGFSFSTTLGASLPTVGGFDVATTGGGAMATVAPFAYRGRVGGDCDITLGVQNTVNRGSAYEMCDVTYRYVPAGEVRWRSDADCFRLQAQEWENARLDYFEELRATLREKKERFDKRLDNVLGAHDVRVVGSHLVQSRSVFLKVPSTHVGMYEEGITMTSESTAFQGEIIEVG